MLFYYLALCSIFCPSGIAAEPDASLPKWSISFHGFAPIAKRQSPGYYPDSGVCGSGHNCAQACGSGYETCPSISTVLHCFSPIHNQTCCPNGSGCSSIHSLQVGYWLLWYAIFQFTERCAFWKQMLVTPVITARRTLRERLSAVQM